MGSACGVTNPAYCNIIKRLITLYKLYQRVNRQW